MAANEQTFLSTPSVSTHQAVDTVKNDAVTNQLPTYKQFLGCFLALYRKSCLGPEEKSKPI